MTEAKPIQRDKRLRRKETPLWARRLEMAFAFAELVDKKGNLDKKRIGKKLNVSYKTVESWTTGRTQPRFEKLIQARAITGISLDWIFADKSSPALPQEYRHETAAVQFLKREQN